MFGLEIRITGTNSTRPAVLLLATAPNNWGKFTTSEERHTRTLLIPRNDRKYRTDRDHRIFSMDQNSFQNSLNPGHTEYPFMTPGQPKGIPTHSQIHSGHQVDKFFWYFYCLINYMLMPSTPSCV